ncbi:MAG: thermonuclease family protein [Pseudomonadota bacterium]
MAANRKRTGGRSGQRKGARRGAGFRLFRSLGLVALGAVIALAATAWFGMPDVDALKRTIARLEPPARVEQTAKAEPRSRAPAARRPDRSIETSALPVPRPSRPVPETRRETKPLPAVARPPMDVTPKAEIPGRPGRTTHLSGLTFPMCGEGGGRNCVVDGDTFVLNGKAVRVADIDTPEAGNPKCRREAELAAKATRRLRELLNAGPLDLVALSRDEDIYGRKLRTVMRDGRSIGDTLIAEGLARRWTGSKRSWCV